MKYENATNTRRPTAPPIAARRKAPRRACALASFCFRSRASSFRSRFAAVVVEVAAAERCASGGAVAGRLRFFLATGSRYPADGNDEGIGFGSSACVPNVIAMVERSVSGINVGLPVYSCPFT